MNPDHYAKEAERLLADDTLNHALDAIRKSALEALAIVSAENTISVLRNQQMVAAIDELRSELRGAVLRRAQPANSTGTFA